MDIQGKTVLVTGAAKRVGRCVALAFARCGAHIVGHYHQSKIHAEQAQKEIQALGVQAEFYSADLGDSKDTRRFLDEVHRGGRSIDLLINSASIFYKTPIATADEKQLDSFMGVNLKAPYLLSLEIGKKMMAGAGGKIINLVDWSAFRPYRDYAAYCASKGALVTLTKSLARDMAPKVSVNGIAPGPVLLPEDMSAEEAAGIAKLTALGRIGSPEDIAHAAIFLAENDFMNGHILVVDGGRSIV